MAAIAAAQTKEQLTAKDIANMLQSGRSERAIVLELSSRPVSMSDPASEKILKEAGASQELINKLKRRGAIPPLPQFPKIVSYQHPATPFSRKETPWIVEQIVRDLAEVTFFSKQGSSANLAELKVECLPRGTRSFQVVVGSSSGRAIEYVLQLDHHLWAEENYTPVATALLSAWRIPTTQPSVHNNHDLLERLTSANPTALIRDSKKLSEELTRSPLNAGLHEEAALVLGCFALREAAGSFNDTRAALSKMTMHLAFARALQAQETDAGRIARIIQLVLVGRQAEALERIASLPAPVDRWATVLKLRATGDWRLLAQPGKASLLEQLEYFRALRQRGLCPKSLDFLESIHAVPGVDWSRIAMEEGLSVQEGHAFAADSLAAELKSLGDAWQSFSGQPLSQDQLGEVLNRPATRCATQTVDGQVQLEVLSWGTLAAFHQRHICHSIVNTHDFFKDALGVPEDAKEFRQFVEQLFAQTRLFPVVQTMLAANSPATAETFAKAAAFAWQHPDLMTAAAWVGLSVKTPEGSRTPVPSEAATWFSDFPLFGTSYDFAFRNRRFLPHKDLFWQTIAGIAPFDREVLRANMIDKFPMNRTVEQTAACFAAIKDFDVRAMWEIAGQCKNQPAVYGKIVEGICALQSDYYIELGNYYVEKEMPHEAASAFQAAFDHASDRVYFANNSGWLVDYYFENNRVEDAMKIAVDAAESYSSGGLETMAVLLERMGRLREAEDYYKKIRERYSRSDELNAFYIRNRQKDAAYERVAADQTALLFPSGVGKVTISDLSIAPVDGVQITSPSERTERAHLRPGHVIVAVNGIRVRSEKEYFYAIDSTLGPNVTYIVWTGKEYIECKANLPERRLKCTIHDYKAQVTASR